MKFVHRNGGAHLTYDVVEATRELLRALRTTSMGEKIASGPHLRAMWDDANDADRVVIASIVSAMRLPERPT